MSARVEEVNRLQMERDNKRRLLDEAGFLIGQSGLNDEEKMNLSQNIQCFISKVKHDQTLKDVKWQWFDEGSDGRGLDLVWDNEYVRGCFGFYTDNGHGYSFEYGDGGWSQTGGAEGEYGFFCSMFIDDFENTLKYLGCI